MKFFFLLQILLTNGIRVDTYGGTIVAFGDSDNNPFVRFLSRFIFRNIRSGKRQDLVCLLGDTLADFERVSQNVDTTFVPVLGGGDHVLYDETSESDPRIILPSRNYMDAREIEKDTEEYICIWAIGSVTFSNETASSLDAGLSDSDCFWNIITTHYPLFSFGSHRLDDELAKFRSLLLPIVKKHEIHLILSAHDQSTQVIAIEGSSAVLLVAGAPVRVDRGSVSEIFTGNVGARLLWHNDWINGLAIKLTYSRDSIVWEIISVMDDDVLLTGLVTKD